MSILSALKAKGAKGKNIEEAVKTLPVENGYKTVKKMEAYYDGYLTTSEVEDVYIEGFPNGIKFDDDVITVTFEGVEYEVEKKIPPLTWHGQYVYGDAGDDGKSIFTRYPFCIYLSRSTPVLHTETAGTYAVKVESLQDAIEVTEEFRNAVKKVIQDMQSDSSEPEPA